MTKQIIDVLKVMGKATAREIAARMKIEPAEALAVLREHEDLGAVTFINGYWDIAATMHQFRRLLRRQPLPRKKQHHCAKTLKLSGELNRPPSLRKWLSICLLKKVR